jgi:hypothetical protein
MTSIVLKKTSVRPRFLSTASHEPLLPETLMWDAASEETMAMECDGFVLDWSFP